MKKLFLAPIAFLYLLTIKFYLWLYNSRFLKTHQIKKSFDVSVGNLSLGGSGKTPMISWLINTLNDQNISCGVVSRGYKRKGKKTIIVSDGQNIKSSVDFAGDEPYMLALEHQKTPVIVGNKITACQLMQKKYKPQ